MIKSQSTEQISEYNKLKSFSCVELLSKLVKANSKYLLKYFINKITF